jgi:hypothetical protein
MTSLVVSVKRRNRIVETGTHVIDDIGLAKPNVREMRG